MPCVVSRECYPAERRRDSSELREANETYMMGTPIKNMRRRPIRSMVNIEKTVNCGEVMSEHTAMKASERTWDWEDLRCS